MNIFVILTTASISLILVLVGIILLLILRDSIFADVPFVPVRRYAVAKIIELLDMRSGDVLVDMGCGDGRILIDAVKTVSKVRGIGMEKGIIPFFVASFLSRNYPVKIRYEEISRTDISSATHIYCYLSPKLMTQLGPKFLRECQPKTKIVSCDFEIPNWMPVKKIDLDVGKETLSRTLYLYQMQ
ncbi:MAG: hypothetical protein WCT49_02960 [Candidatus Paceibacterota bacterium]|jgi:hypothetical protein|nr:hypothetical protein [Candidatus Paceibacterota bacterium]